MNDVGPGADVAAAGSVVVLLLAMAALATPIVVGVAALIWALKSRHKARRATS